MLRRSAIRAVQPSLSQAGTQLVGGLRHPSLFSQLCVVNGAEAAASTEETLPVVLPCTQQPLGTIPSFSTADTQAAIDAAEAAFPAWAAQTPTARAKLLARWSDFMGTHQDDFAAILSAESGKPVKEAAGEHTYSRGYVDWYAGEAERVYGDIVTLPRPGVRALVRKSPVGVVAVITPWNFPSAMITRAVAGALAAGCTVVVKPSELTPFTALALARAALEVGIPPGVFNVVTGQAQPVGKALLSSETVRKLSFTGSSAVGVELYKQCAPTVKKMALELGGNAPFIVCPDADMNLVVEGVFNAKFRNCGQVCIAANRFYVPRSLHDAFVTAIKTRIASQIKQGNGGPSFLPGTDPSVTLGPLISPIHAAKVVRFIDRAVEEGAKLELGGGYVQGMPKTFVAPTILTGVKDTMEIARGEIFGPVVSILEYDDADLDGVIASANNVRAGLAAYVFTSDYKKQWRLSEQLQCGMVGVNEGAIGSPMAPFGGVKSSGLGRDGSKYGIDQFFDVKYTLMGGNI